MSNCTQEWIDTVHALAAEQGKYYHEVQEPLEGWLASCARVLLPEEEYHRIMEMAVEMYRGSSKFRSKP